MTFIQTVPEGEASGLLKELYEAETKARGYIPGFASVFSLHPEVYDAWKKLIAPVRDGMRLRRFELLTFATAMALGCTY